MRGNRGFRFEETLGGVVIDIPTSSLLRPIGINSIQHVQLALDASLGDGVIFRVNDAKARIILGVQRLALRLGTLQQLLVVDDEQNSVALLGFRATGYDLDFARTGEVSNDLDAINAVSQEAAILARSEIERHEYDSVHSHLEAIRKATLP